MTREIARETDIIQSKLNFYYRMLEKDITFKQGRYYLGKIKELEQQKELLSIKK